VVDGQKIATGPYATTLVGVTWAKADGLGYYFPGKADVRAEIADRSGDWSKIGANSGAVTARFLTLSLNHGTTPTGAKYAYAIALGDQDMASWTAGSPITIVKNEPTLAAVRSGGATGVVFFAPGSIDVAQGIALTTDAPCVVWITDDGELMTLSIADPAQGTDKLHLSLRGAFIDSQALDTGATVTRQAADAAIGVDRHYGYTHVVRLSRERAIPPADAGPIVPAADAGAADSAPPIEPSAPKGDAGAVDADRSAAARTTDAAASTQKPAASAAADVESQDATEPGSGCSCSFSRTTSPRAPLLLALLALALCRSRRSERVMVDRPQPRTGR
jgi:hypothetical protein